MTPEESAALYKRVRENRKKFEDCPQHSFNYPENFAELPMFDRARVKFVCVHCGCECEPRLADAYARGFRAAGGDVEQVLKDFY